jgi:hypothetical protein
MHHSHQSEIERSQGVIMRKFFCLLATAIPSLFAVTSQAGTVVCSGTIEQVHFHASDTMLVKLSGMNTSVFFCHPSSQFSVPGTSYTTSPEMCRTLVSILMAGKLAGKTIAAMYFDGDDVPASCTEWGNWKSANIRYVHWAD